MTPQSCYLLMQHKALGNDSAKGILILVFELVGLENKQDYFCL
jgi:hypothetical protein